MLHSEAKVPTAFGVFRVRVYDGARDDGPVAIIGDGFKSPAPLARIHRACFLSENLGYTGCDCRERLAFALETIAARGGVVVYLRHGLGDQLRHRHHHLDHQSFATAARVLRELGVDSVQLIGDDGDAAGLAAHGINVGEQRPSALMLLGGVD